MIHVVYSSPCTYDPNRRGFAEFEIAYAGQDPIAQVLQAITRIPRALVYSATYNGRAIIDEGFDCYGRYLN